MTMSATKDRDHSNELYVFKNENEEEIVRLDYQHKLASDCCDGTLIHPNVPTSSIMNVADIATGTGIWLEEVCTQLSSQEIGPSEVHRRFDGFDISTAKFPKDGKGCYALQDVLKPFPSQYHGLYDLVHVRLLLAAIKSDQYLETVRNLMALLKPGGYIQWEEFDIDGVSSAPKGPVHTKLVDHASQLIIKLGMSTHCSTQVVDALKAVGMEDIIREERNSYWYKDLASRTMQWSKVSLENLLPPALLASGVVESQEEAKRETESMLEELDREYGTGVIPNFPLRSMVGKKPL
jgi:hypothetical protein